MISIIILTLNSEKFIYKCLESVFSLEHDGCEVLVVDNGSTDKTVQIIKASFPEVALIEKDKNIGASAARNLAISNTKGKWVLTLDCDVILDKNFLSIASRYLVKLDKKIGFIQAKILNDNRTTIYSCGVEIGFFRRLHDLGKGQKAESSFCSSQNVFAACAAAAFYKREMLDEVKEKTGYFDERFFFLVEEVDLSWRAQKKGWQGVFLPDLQCFHEGNSSGLCLEKRQWLCFRNRFYMIAKNCGVGKYAIRIIPLLFYDVPRGVYLFVFNGYFRKNIIGLVRQALFIIGKKDEFKICFQP